MHHIHDGFSNHFTYYLLDSQILVRSIIMNIYELTLHRNTTIHFAILFRIEIDYFDYFTKCIIDEKLLCN